MKVRKKLISTLTAGIFLSAFASEPVIHAGAELFRSQRDSLDAAEQPVTITATDTISVSSSAVEPSAVEPSAAEAPLSPDSLPQADSTGVTTDDTLPAQQSGRLTNRTIVNIKSRKVTPVHVGDSTVYAYVGNVVAYHNGALMLCDSAVRYDENRIECFDNVLINKDSTYVYGDRILYNRITNTAQVFAPLIKMIDGSAVLYTYNFQYNTLDNIGTYHGGGTLSQKGMLLESDRGYYFGDTRDAVCVGAVELRDSTYLIRSDSLGFNMDTEIATFYRKTYIWNDNDEILSAEAGWYDTKTEHYNFTSDAYVLSEDQEVWADDMDYRAERDDVIMQRNIQIIDREHEVIAFGDYGQYWGERGDAMLTDNPSVISYRQNDSVYMRADSIFMYVIDSTSVYSANYIGAKKLMDEIAENSDELPEEQNLTGFGTGDTAELVTAPESDSKESESIADDPDIQEDDNEVEIGDTTEMSQPEDLPDTISADETTSLPDEMTVSQDEQNNPEPEIPSPKELKQEARRQEREARKAARQAAKRSRNNTDNDNSVSPESTNTTDENLSAADDSADPESVTLTETDESEISASTEDDGTANIENAGSEQDAAESDNSISGQNQDDDEEPERVIVAYQRVKIYRSDLQAICDSLVSFSRDTTVHMYKSPVMWNGANQIKSDSVTVYIVNENIDNAIFYSGEDHGNPIMSAKLDQHHYNQITGKSIQALFRDNEIYRTNVVGNGQTYYYMQDEETHAYQGFLVMECSDISFLITDQEIEEIIFRGNPSYSIYPMNMIPESQPQQFQNFVWEGELRPFKQQVFNRTIRPSQRQSYEQLPHPDFPITKRINTYRDRLVSSGNWRDRDDDITYDALDFMHRMQNQGL